MVTGASLLKSSVPIFESVPRNGQIIHRRGHPVTRVQLIDKFGAYRLQQGGLIMGQFWNPVHDARLIPDQPERQKGQGHADDFIPCRRQSYSPTFSTARTIPAAARTRPAICATVDNPWRASFRP